MISELTGSSSEFSIGELKVEVFPMRALHWGVIENWMRNCVLNVAKSCIKGDNELTSKESESIMRSAHKEASKISLMSCFGVGEKDEMTNAFLYSFEGMLRVIQQGLRTSSAKDSTTKFSLLDLDELIGNDLSTMSELFMIVIGSSFPKIDNEEMKQNFKKAEQSP